MIPQDPIILLSYINTQLRDNYSSLDELCASLSLDRQELTAKLEAINYVYEPSLNKFV